jgi:hypothetical protein
MVVVPACLSSSNSGGDPPAPAIVPVPANDVQVAATRTGMYCF